LGDDGHGAPYMEMTTDAGDHWDEQLLPQANVLRALGTTPALYFTNAVHDWWQDGGLVWATADGGRTWSLQAPPTENS
jgi:photosystem II stability/assembly factor-like uncharacterized protein